ncbi:Protein SLOW WALKER 1 [Forsythia ovata]|uniref:Protein SLOW WALKER 1 n=1 Tax=Forsythia ovata TaxID=205694 RepID=A0ABD1UEB6_9LAMI
MPHPPDAEESKRNSLPPITTPNHSSTTKHTHYTHHLSFSSIRNPSTGNPSNTHYTLFPIAHHDFTVTHSANITIFSGKTLEPKTTIASAFVDSATFVAFRCDGKLLAVGYLTGTELHMGSTPVEDGGFKYKIGSDGGEIGEL